MNGFSRQEKKTVVLPKERISPAKWLNEARDSAHRARKSAAMVGTAGSYFACIVLAFGEALLDQQTDVVSRRLEQQEQPLRHIFIIFTILLFPLVAFAQAASLPVDIPTQEALGQFFASLGGLKGAAILGIVAFVLQTLLLVLRTPLANFAGKWRLLIVAGVSLIAGTISLVATGMPVLEALGHANTLGALQVLTHQMFVQFKSDKA